MKINNHHLFQNTIVLEPNRGGNKIQLYNGQYRFKILVRNCFSCQTEDTLSKCLKYYSATPLLMKYVYELLWSVTDIMLMEYVCERTPLVQRRCRVFRTSSHCPSPIGRWDILLGYLIRLLGYVLRRLILRRLIFWGCFFTLLAHVVTAFNAWC